MREENPFTLHVCTDCIGRLETKIVLLLSGASEKRGMMRTCCPTEEGENPCSEAMDGQLAPEQGQKQRSIEDLQKGVFQALLSSILQGNPCRWLLGPSPSIPSHEPLPSTPLPTTLICYDQRGHHQHLRFWGDLTFPIGR